MEIEYITKEDIGKKISVDEYNAACRREVMKYTKEWTNLTKQMICMVRTNRMRWMIRTVWMSRTRRMIRMVWMNLRRRTGRMNRMEWMILWKPMIPGTGK